MKKKKMYARPETVVHALHGCSPLAASLIVSTDVVDEGNESDLGYSNRSIWGENNSSKSPWKDENR